VITRRSSFAVIRFADPTRLPGYRSDGGRPKSCVAAAGGR